MTTKALVVLIICWPIPLLHFWQLISHRHGCRWTPFFGWPLTIKYWLHFFTVVFFWLFIPNVLGAVFSQLVVSAPFFSQLVFLAWTKAPPASFTVVRTTSKNPPSHDNALCTLCLRFHGKSFSGLLLLRIRQHILYLYFVWHMLQNCIEMCKSNLEANFGYSLLL